MSVVCLHNAGFFSCCSVKLHMIVSYINNNLKLPNLVDSSNSFDWYKKNLETKDITYEYFEHYDNITDMTVNYPIKYNHDYQFFNYSHIDYNNIIPIIKKYFSPSKEILNIIEKIELKYKLNYNNICVLFFRGNDKVTETELPNYNDYLIYINIILKNNPDILFLIQSDETEFIEFISEKFPKNSFYFKDEIRHMKRKISTVDYNKDRIDEFSKNYLAITIIMSKCKYIICGSGNCSIWIMFYRGNNENVYQFLNNRWIINNKNDHDWQFIANENDDVTNINIGAHIRYGAHGYNWIESYNKNEKFKVLNSYFGVDPVPGIPKQLQICTKCLIV
jgi:hypothetical protein